MNCAVKVIQDTSCLPGATPALPTPKKTAPIKSSEDLIRRFPDRFQGIGQFPAEYIIRLCDNAQPVIHAPWKCPISIHPNVKAELDKMVKFWCHQPCRWTNRLGLISSICLENVWWVMHLFGSSWPQQCHLQGPSLHTHSWWSSSWVCSLKILHKVGCQTWILGSHPWL